MNAFRAVWHPAGGRRGRRVLLLAVLVMPLILVGGQAPASGEWQSVEFGRGWGAHPGGVATHGEQLHLALRRGRQGAWRGLAYAHCAGQCTDPAHWQVVPLLDRGQVHPTIRVDAHGRPRIGFWQDGELRFAACDSDCGTARSWRFTTLERVERPDRNGAYEHLIGDFALDANGRPRFAYPAFRYRPDGKVVVALRYAECDSSCADVSGWHLTTVEAVTHESIWVYQVALEFDGALPRVGFFGWNRRTNALVEGFAQCSGGCRHGVRWGAVALPTTASNPYGVTLAVRGSAVHLAYPNQSTGVHYLRCEGDCLSPASWSATALAWAHEHASAPDLAVTHDGQVLIAVLGIGPDVVPDGNGGRSAAEDLHLLRCADARLCATTAGWRSTRLSHVGRLVDPHALAIVDGSPVISYSPWRGSDRVGLTWCSRACAPDRAALTERVPR